MQKHASHSIRSVESRSHSDGASKLHRHHKRVRAQVDEQHRSGGEVVEQHAVHAENHTSTEHHAPAHHARAIAQAGHHKKHAHAKDKKHGAKKAAA